MYSIVETDSRENFISLFNALGRNIMRAGRGGPWFANLGGDWNSGKELAALAIDQELNPNPERYPSGIIPRDTRAEISLARGNGGNPQVVFQNFCRVNSFNTAEFDNELKKFNRRNPRASILIASNLERNYRPPFDDNVGELESYLLDADITVRKVHGGGFIRRVEFMFRDTAVLTRTLEDFNARTEKREAALAPFRDAYPLGAGPSFGSTQPQA